MVGYSCWSVGGVWRGERAEGWMTVGPVGVLVAEEHAVH